MNKIKQSISDFGFYLWNRFRVITATELMMLEQASRPRKCEHCHLSPIHYLDDCDCKKDVIEIVQSFNMLCPRCGLVGHTPKDYYKCIKYNQKTSVSVSK